MEYFVVVGLAVLSLVFIIIDLIAHNVLKVKRNVFGWIFISSMVIMLALTGYLSIKNINTKSTKNDAATYLSYRYLLDADTQNARILLKESYDSDTEQAYLLELLTLCVEEDYSRAYFLSNRLLNEGIVKKKNAQSVAELNKLSAQVLNISEDDGAGVDFDESAKEVSLLEESSTEETVNDDMPIVVGDYEEEYNQKINESRDIVQGIILESFNSQPFGDPIKLEKAYKLDREHRSGEFGELSQEEILSIVKEYDDDPTILKSAIKYTARNKDYKKSMELAEKLLEDDRSKENYLIYTDVLAQGVTEGYEFNRNDEEKRELKEQAKELEEKASEYYELDERKIKLTQQADDLKKRAENLDIYRAINYLEAKKPIFFDSSGMYDVQIAKLYLVADEREKAKKRIYELMDNASVISDNSPIKEPLIEVIDAYNQSGADETSPVLKSSVTNLVKAESQDIIPIEADTINGKFANYITSTLKYDKIGIFVSRIDTSNYPEIAAYLNINGEKDNIIGLADDFKEKDFELVDTQYLIKDFKIDKENKKAETSISIVLDCSGSMAGQPLADALTAADACVDKMNSSNQYLSIVAYSEVASVVTSKTNISDSLKAGIRSISSTGGTNIPAGIEAGIGTLRSSSGNKAIILLTDGQDGNTGEMEAAIEKAKESDISIFTVGLGDVNSDYLRDIAEKTGGKFILTATSAELEDIYVTLQKYIVNNYCIKYTVEKNPEEDPRNLLVSIPKYQASGNKDYTLREETIEEEKSSSVISPVTENTFKISAVSPNNFSYGDIQKGREITISGYGFTEAMKISIGELELKNVRFEDSTTVKGILKGELAAGSYQLKIVTADGRVAMKDNALRIFRAGMTTKVRLGSTVITADSIGQTGEKELVATGNVLINGFIHCDGDIVITANNLPEDFDIATGSMAYLGDAGVLSGNARLYINYAQLSGAGSVRKSFAKLALGGQDYIIKDGKFAIGINGTASDFDTTMDTADLQIPFIADVKIARMKLYSDRIQVSIEELNPVRIINNIKDGTKGNVLTSKKEQEALYKPSKTVKRDEAFKFKPSKALGGSMDIAITADDIKVGLVVKLDAKNSISFGSIGLQSAELKINSLDPSNEYWKFKGEIDFSKIVKGFGGTGVSGLNGHISSYYWCLDEIEITADLYPGIPIYNAVYIDKMGLNLDGASTLFINSGWIPDNAKKLMFADDNLSAVKQKDVILSGIVAADANLFKSFKLKVPKDFTKWGQLGEIDGKISYNFSDVEFGITADLKILKQKLANASVKFGKSGIGVNAGAQLDLSMLDCSIGGAVDFGINSSWTMLTLSMGVKGNLDCGFLDVHYKGDSSLEFMAEYDASYFAVKLSQNNLVNKYWYDSDGKPLLWNRFHKATYFE